MSGLLILYPDFKVQFITNFSINFLFTDSLFGSSVDNTEHNYLPRLLGSENDDGRFMFLYYYRAMFTVEST